MPSVEGRDAAHRHHIALCSRVAQYSGVNTDRTTSPCQEAAASPRADRIYNVLFLCTGNSARSIMSESILRKDGAARFRAFSAGYRPAGRVNPLALKILARFDYPIDGLRSKSWDEFAGPGAPIMDFVFSVCDDAAEELCPKWPGQPMSARWGIGDPVAAEGSDIEKEAAFLTAFRYLKVRIGTFLTLPLDRIGPAALDTTLQEIGRSEGATPPRPGQA